MEMVSYMVVNAVIIRSERSFRYNVLLDFSFRILKELFFFHYLDKLMPDLSHLLKKFDKML